MKKLLALTLALVLLALPLTACKEEEADLEVLFLAAGKADVILVEIGEINVLIDTGYQENYTAIKNTLNAEGINRIDHMILTHFDEDHIGSAALLLSSCEVGTLYLPDYAGTNSEYSDLTTFLTSYDGTVRTVTEAIALTLGAFQMNIDPTTLTSLGDDDNNHSLIVSVKEAGFSMLLMGDALKDRVKEYATRDISHYDVVKLPHHGDYFKALGEYLDKITPTYAIHCCEAGAVDDKLTAACDERGITHYTTGVGTVHVRYNIAHKHLTVIQE